jgi:hypothetical protein
MDEDFKPGDTVRIVDWKSLQCLRPDGTPYKEGDDVTIINVNRNYVYIATQDWDGSWRAGGFLKFRFQRLPLEKVAYYEMGNAP